MKYCNSAPVFCHLLETNKDKENEKTKKMDTKNWIEGYFCMPFVKSQNETGAHTTVFGLLAVPSCGGRPPRTMCAWFGLYVRNAINQTVPYIPYINKHNIKFVSIRWAFSNKTTDTLHTISSRSHAQNHCVQFDLNVHRLANLTNRDHFGYACAPRVIVFEQEVKQRKTDEHSQSQRVNVSLCVWFSHVPFSRSEKRTRERERDMRTGRPSCVWIGIDEVHIKCNVCAICYVPLHIRLRYMVNMSYVLYTHISALDHGMVCSVLAMYETIKCVVGACASE